jgi:hypothetical protein
MRDSLVLALGRTRARLNAVIALHRAFAWAAPSAVAAGILVATARTLGIAAAGYPLWAALVLIGAAAGALASRKSFTSEESAARWLDSRLGDEELLSAALACRRSGSEGRFDSALAERAEVLLPIAASVKVPRAPMAKRGGIAAVGLLFGAYFIFLSGTARAPVGEAAARPREQAGLDSAEKAATAASALKEGGPVAAAFASALFPGDKRMARLTERALREGRIDDLRDLLKAAGLDIDAKLAGSVAENERKSLARDRERLGDAAKALALAMAATASASGEGGAPSTGGSTREGGGGQGGASPRAPGAQGMSPNAENGGPESGAGGARGEAGGSGSAGLAAPGGKGYGSGAGSEGDWGAVKPASKTGSVAIAAPKDPSFFELILPGSDAASAVAGLAPASRRSAEAAMTREGLPLEYEDFVRSYFLSLSQGESK